MGLPHPSQQKARGTRMEDSNPKEFVLAGRRRSSCKGDYRLCSISISKSVWPGSARRYDCKGELPHPSQQRLGWGTTEM